MAMIYDSAEVRRAAGTVRRSLERITSTALPKVRSIRNSLDANFEGAAADALDKNLSDLDSDIGKIASALSMLNRTLLKFAEEIDAADAKIKSSMQ